MTTEVDLGDAPQSKRGALDGPNARKELAQQHSLTRGQVMALIGLHARMTHPEHRQMMTAFYYEGRDLLDVKRGLTALSQDFCGLIQTILEPKEAPENIERATEKLVKPYAAHVIMRADDLPIVAQEDLVELLHHPCAPIILCVQKDPGDLLRDRKWTQAFRSKVFTMKWPSREARKAGMLPKAQVLDWFRVGVELGAAELGIKTPPIDQTAYNFIAGMRHSTNESERVVEAGKKAVCHMVILDDKEVRSNEIFKTVGHRLSELITMAHSAIDRRQKQKRS